MVRPAIVQVHIDGLDVRLLSGVEGDEVLESHGVADFNEGGGFRQHLVTDERFGWLMG